MKIFFKQSCLILIMLLSCLSVEGQSYVFSGNMYTQFTDLILKDDPSSFQSIDYVKTAKIKMPVDWDYDRKTLVEFPVFDSPEVFVYTLKYDDGISAEVRVASQDFSRSESDELVNKYAYKMGQLPACLRKGVKYINFNKSGKSVWPFPEEKTITYLIDKMSDINDKVKRTEEYLMFLAAQVAISPLIDKESYDKACVKDQTMITYNSRYTRPDIGDSFMAFTLLNFKGLRADAEDTQKIKEGIPNRLQYFDQFKSDMYPVAAKTGFDPNKYYRLTTLCSGQTRALSVVNEGDTEQIKMRSNVDEARQLWKIKDLGKGKYQISSKYKGENLTLSAIDNQDKVALSSTNYTWEIKYISKGSFFISTTVNGKMEALRYNLDKKDLSFKGNFPRGMSWEITEID